MSSLLGICGGGNVGSAGGSFYDYSIDQSLRFDAASESELSRTFAAGNRRKWTFSTWMKRSELTPSGNDDYIFGTNTGAANSTFMFLNWRAGDDLIVTGQSTLWLRSDRVFRDVSGWYHIVWSLDTDNATASQRMRLYINGSELTSFSTDSRSSLSGDQAINAAVEHNIGRHPTATGYGLGAYLAETHFVDGQALSPSDFGQTSNGVWVPKAYSGSYGTNGFYLDFSTDSYTDNASDPDVFADQAGSNDWNAYNLAAHEIVPDSPTNNFCTWNPLVYTNQTRVFRDGNTNLFSSAQTWSTGAWNQGTIGVTGGTSDTKFYFEFIANVGGSGYIIGVGRAAGKALSTTTYDGAVFLYNTQIRSDSTVVVSGLTSASALDVIRIAFDASNGKVWIGNASGWFNSGDPAAGTGEVGTISNYEGEILVPLLNRPDLTNGYMIINCGQDDTFAGVKTSGSAAAQDDNGIGKFYLTPPSGFLALCTSNLPEPTIGPNSTTTSDEHFNTVLYTGDGTTSNAITGVGFQPDFVWIKRRNNANPHFLNDSVRGATKDLRSDATDAETTNNQYGILKSFDSDGFTVSVGSSNGARANTSGGTFVAWNWKAGGTAASNTDGSITTSVSTNADAGISIIKYTGNGTNGATIGHNLGVTPDHIIIKRTSSTEAWVNWHQSFSATQYLRLNATNAVDTATTLFNSTLPSSSVITLGTGGFVNTSSEDYICYAFAEKEGFSKFGTYVGNGNADGTFVHTGFRPAFILLKRSSSSGTGWSILDATRNTFNAVDKILQPNVSTAEQTSFPVDFCSNGFKWRTSDGTHNASATFIYLAFAESSFKYSNAR